MLIILFLLINNIMEQRYLCVFAYMVAGSLFYFMMNRSDTFGCKDMIASFGTEMSNEFTKIVAARAKNAYTGMLLGMVLAYVLMSMYPEKFGSCSYLGIALATTYVYYHFAKKPPRMESLLSPDMAKKYKETCGGKAGYNHMMGSILGLLAYVFIAPNSWIN